MRGLLSLTHVCVRHWHGRLYASAPVLRTAVRFPHPGSLRFSSPEKHSSTRVLHSQKRCCRSAASASSMVGYSMEDLVSPELPAVHFTDQVSGELVAVCVYEEDLKLEGKEVQIASDRLKELDQEYGGALSDILSAGSFKGKPATSCFVREGQKTKWVGLLGLGPAASASLVADWGVSVYQALGDQLAIAAKANKAETASVVFCTQPQKEKAAAIGGKISMGVFLGGYESTKFKAEPKVSPLKDVGLVMESPDTDEEISKSKSMASGVKLARALVETPSNVCSPQHMADVAMAIADKFPDVMQVEILEKEDCEKLNMGCYLAVAKASEFPPKFIHMKYTPKGTADKKIAVIGKGLSFDSGGYNIKVRLMETMKLDMGGAAATLGAAMILAALKPEGAELHFIVAACENMIAGNGYRPGDVLTASNGKTVEVINTDAEGRLTLADAIVYAQDTCGASTIVESSTLTGACMVALGTNISALYATNEALAESLLVASKEAGEKLWRMPLEDSYVESLKSPIADLKNLGGSYGGSITAALFLREFVDTQKAEFAHMDISGPAMKLDTMIATGFGAALLAEWACKASSAKTV